MLGSRRWFGTREPRSVPTLLCDNCPVETRMKMIQPRKPGIPKVWVCEECGHVVGRKMAAMESLVSKLRGEVFGLWHCAAEVETRPLCEAMHMTPEEYDAWCDQKPSRR